VWAELLLGALALGAFVSACAVLWIVSAVLLSRHEDKSH